MHEKSPLFLNAFEHFITVPAKPKGNGEEIKLSEGVFNFTFEGSTGQIKGYRVTIEGVFNSVFTFTPWISDVYLKPGTAYAYSIIAVNGNGDESEPLVDTFQVRGESQYRFGLFVYEFALMWFIFVNFLYNVHFQLARIGCNRKIIEKIHATIFS